MSRNLSINNRVEGQPFQPAEPAQAPPTNHNHKHNQQQQEQQQQQQQP